MTEPERSALEHIRRVVDSILGAPSSPDSATETPAATDAGLQGLLPVPFVPQTGVETGGRASDGGPAAGAMLVRAYTSKTPSPDEFLKKTGQQAGKPLTLQQLITGLNSFSVAVEQRSNLKMGDLALLLLNGRPAIIPVKYASSRQAGLSAETRSTPQYLVVVGMDMRQVYVHDPLQPAVSGQGLGIPVLTFYQAWAGIDREANSPALEHAGLIPRMALIRRVRVTTTSLNVRGGPGSNFPVVGQVKGGEVFEITHQQGEWGNISENRWISLNFVQDI